MSLLSSPQFAKNEKGAAMVEFAIVFPLLLIVIFGVIEWGLYMYNRQVLTNAAREGARHGVLMRAAPRTVVDKDGEIGEDTIICDRVSTFASKYLITFGEDTLSCDEDGKSDVMITRDTVNQGDTSYPPVNSFVFGTDLRVQVDYEYDFLFLSLPPLDLGPLLIIGQATMKME